MNEKIKKQDDEINFFDLFAMLWQRKVMVIVIISVAIIGVVVLSIISKILPPEKSFLPNVYTPETLMLIDDKSSSGGGLSSLLSGGMGDLASLAGIGSNKTNSKFAVFLVGTNSLLDAVIDEFDLISRYKIKNFPGHPVGRISKNY
jgi:uncharacterized protein involved in exopolysaccharide biosynthesis